MWRIVAIAIALAVPAVGCSAGSGSGTDPLSSAVRATVADWKSMQRAQQALIRADRSFNKEMSGCKVYTALCVVEAGGRVRSAVLRFAAAERKASHDVGLGARCDDLLRRAAAAADSVAAEYGAAVRESSNGPHARRAVFDARLNEAHRREARWYLLLGGLDKACPTNRRVADGRQ